MANKESITGNPDLSVEQKTIHLILCVARLGISPLQVQILHILSKASREGLTVNQIKGRMADESPNVSRALNKLMANKLILKQRSDTDQRVVWIRITQKGMAMLEVAENAMAPLQKLPLSSPEIDELYGLLQKL